MQAFPSPEHAACATSISLLETELTTLKAKLATAVQEESKWLAAIHKLEDVSIEGAGRIAELEERLDVAKGLLAKACTDLFDEGYTILSDEIDAFLSARGEGKKTSKDICEDLSGKKFRVSQDGAVEPISNAKEAADE